MTPYGTPEERLEQRRRTFAENGRRNARARRMAKYDAAVLARVEAEAKQRKQSVNEYLRHMLTLAARYG